MRRADRVRKRLMLGVDQTYGGFTKPTRLTHLGNGSFPLLGLLFTSLQGQNLNAKEIGWPFRLGLEGCIVDRSQPEMLQRRGADDDAIIAFGV